jgi:hypothetical protein
MRISGLLVALLLAGCGTPLERDKVAKIPSVDVVVVETPPVQVMTVMQAFVKSPYGDGLLPGLIADAEGKALVRPPAIPDIAQLVVHGLRQRVPPWFPKMSEPPQVAKADHVHPRESLRVVVERYEVAPAPLRTVFATVEVSLRDTANQPLWSQRKTFSGFTHGGEKIEIERLNKGDTSQLRTEVERAAQWLANEFAGSMQ